MPRSHFSLCAVVFSSVVASAVLPGAIAFAADPAAGSALAVKAYEDRRDSLTALDAAYRDATGKAGKSDPTLRSHIDTALAEAQRRHEAGDSAAARAVLDDAYRALTRALAALKSVPATAAAPVLQTAAVTESAVRKPDQIRADLDSAVALLGALKRQESQKHMGKAADISAIEGLLKDAQAAFGAKDYARADQLVREAYPRAKASIAGMQPRSEMKTGSAALEARQNSTGGLDAAQLRETYTRRESSVVALLEASERGAAGASTAESAEARKILLQAQAEAGGGRYPAAIALLDKAYQLLKRAITTQRHGQQAVAEKRFAAVDEEFRYEQARNQDYLTLIEVFAQQGDAGVKSSFEEARALRKRGDLAANGGQWEIALKEVAESTLGLKRILRQAGFPIL